MKGLFFVFCILIFASASAQYPPQAGIAGSDAVFKTSAAISGWATSCRIYQGLQQAGNSAGGYVQSGDSSLAAGIADGMVVSLGDSGVAVLMFATPILNMPGPDFAVFENGFLNPADPEEAFLELAFVEVSSDGVNYVRFPAASLTQDTAQLSSIAGMNYMNARLLHNLAGKYISGWGTPFDLQELAGTPGLDVNRITHVRIVDVTGDIRTYKSYDASGRIINDPFPTAFPTGGFDLDGVAVLNRNATGITNTLSGVPEVNAYPNPATDLLFIKMTVSTGNTVVSLCEMAGRILYRKTLTGNTGEIFMKELPAGVYFLTVQDEKGGKWVEKIYKQ